ncbi:M1 family metallopeptidase [Kitasatospora sp. NPDC057223]|uniref:M1 family metallopeptidase n=1 Tax=Kitasatospora sp. NPDC057223 TaxID=3346055 RepID=UPI00363EA12A
MVIALFISRTCLAAVLAVTVVHGSGAAPAQPAAPVGAPGAFFGRPAPPHGDPVFPGLGNTGYDALGYDLAFDYLADSRTVNAVAGITARALEALPRFELDALGLAVHGVRVDGRPAGFALHDEKLTVTPEREVRRGATMTVTVEYSADPRARLPHTAWIPTADGFAIAGQPKSAHTVFPCNDHPADKAAVTVRITAPSRTLGVAGGTLTETAERDGRTTRTYVSRDPMATELVQVSVGDYVVREHPGPGGLPLRDVVPVARASAVQPALDLTSAQLGWIEQRLGAFPFEAYGLMPADTDDGRAFDFTGLETQSLTLYKPGFLAQPEPQIAPHMMHELVHAWFGDSVSPRTWADLWLNEGHADYYGLLYRYERGWPDGLGLTSLEANMRDTYARGDQWRLDSGPVAAPTAANLFDSQRYAGGVLVLFALREKVGAAAFERIERAFLERYRYGSASTRDFIATASEVSGQDLDAFLNDWLYGTRTPPMPGHPDWTPAPAVPRDSGLAGARQGTATL